MKILFENCRIVPEGGTFFCTEGGRFRPAAPPFARRIDLDGAFVLPAFPDAHSHLLAYALSLLRADGGHCRSAEDFVRAAEAFATGRGLDAGALVTVGNADVLPGGDAFETHSRPLHVQMRSGHAGAFNAATRALLGLNTTAALEEGAYLAAARKVPLPEEADVLRAFRRAQRDYLAHGMTTAQEGLLSREMFPLYEMLLRERALIADAVAYPAPADYDEACARFAGARKFTVGGVKIFLDGSPQQKTAYLREPYAGGGRGVLEMTEDAVLSACRFAAARGAQLLAHCNGDGAAAVLLAALTRLPRGDRAQIRPVLVHGQILGDDQLDAAAQLGVIPSFFPAHVLYWGDLHCKNLGDARAERISPARSALERGIPFTLHQDTPVCPPDPLEAARCAVLRETAGGKRFPAQAIGVRDALRALTENAAAQYGDGSKGRIEAGRYADFVVLRGDPFRDLRGTRVAETWLRAKRVFRAAE